MKPNSVNTFFQKIFQEKWDALASHHPAKLFNFRVGFFLFHFVECPVSSTSHRTRGMQDHHLPSFTEEHEGKHGEEGGQHGEESGGQEERAVFHGFNSFQGMSNYNTALLLCQHFFATFLKYFFFQ